VRIIIVLRAQEKRGEKRSIQKLLGRRGGGCFELRKGKKGSDLYTEEGKKFHRGKKKKLAARGFEMPKRENRAGPGGLGGCRGNSYLLKRKRGKLFCGTIDRGTRK